MCNVWLCPRLCTCEDGAVVVNMYIPGDGCVFEGNIVTTCMYASLTLNPICVRSARWDQYGKTALQLAETNKHGHCVYLLKRVKE